ncbi:MAG TPA: hypothetical protein VHP83_03230 [Aggregatilineaceae bacterium]|nr:hypothetical protein [Aggregatilineaceae bacterium]
MGVLTDLLVATEADLEAIGEMDYPLGQFPGLDAKGLDWVSFATLQELVTGEPYDDVLKLYDPVLIVSDDGPWISKIPANLVERLASLTETERRTIGSRWAQTEELKRWWAEEVVQDVLKDICDLAVRVISQPDHVLLMWICT